MVSRKLSIHTPLAIKPHYGRISGASRRVQLPSAFRSSAKDLHKELTQGEWQAAALRLGKKTIKEFKAGNSSVNHFVIASPVNIGERDVIIQLLEESIARSPDRLLHLVVDDVSDGSLSADVRRGANLRDNYVVNMWSRLDFAKINKPTVLVTTMSRLRLLNKSDGSTFRVDEFQAHLGTLVAGLENPDHIEQAGEIFPQLRDPSCSKAFFLGVTRPTFTMGHSLLSPAFGEDAYWPHLDHHQMGSLTRSHKDMNLQVERAIAAKDMVLEAQDADLGSKLDFLNSE